LEYIRSTRTLRFRNTPRAFLILDGQHRVFGFQKAQATLRVPVVIYNDLSKAEEARLFIAASGMVSRTPETTVS
jgi:hypothetical protein